jgi:hypothetical protein
MGDVWYRGENANLPPSKPGGNIMNLGDGLYLTDSEEVAWLYVKARTAPAPEDYRVWQVELDRSTLGKVLDLTASAGWEQFLGANDPMLLGKSRKFYLKSQPNLYNQFFQEYLTKNNIDINTYDAVIAPEYVYGGKQLCIRSKQGASTQMQDRVRTLMRPEEWAERLAKTGAARKSGNEPEPQVEAQPGLTLKNVAKGVAVGAVVLGIGMITAYLNQLMLDRFNEKHFAERMKWLQPELDRFFVARQRVILDNLSDGQPAFIVATIVSQYVSSWEEDETGGMSSGYGGAVLAGVVLDALSVGSRKTEGPGRQTTEYRHLNSAKIDSAPYTYSFPVSLSKSLIDSYRQSLKKAKWLRSVVNDPNLFESDRKALLKERDDFEEWLNKEFGVIKPFQPDPKLWTEDGAARISGG